MFQQLRCGRWYFLMLDEHRQLNIMLKLQFLIKNPSLAMSTQLNEMGACFPKDEGVGDWKSGEIRIGQSPTLGKKIFSISWASKN